MPKIVTVNAGRGLLIRAQLIIVIAPSTEMFSIFDFFKRTRSVLFHKLTVAIHGRCPILNAHKCTFYFHGPRKWLFTAAALTIRHRIVGKGDDVCRWVWTDNDTVVEALIVGG